MIKIEATTSYNIVGLPPGYTAMHCGKLRNGTEFIITHNKPCPYQDAYYGCWIRETYQEDFVKVMVYQACRYEYSDEPSYYQFDIWAGAFIIKDNGEATFNGQKVNLYVQ